MSYNVHVTNKSNNAKTGPIPVSTSTASTCPASCPFNTKNAGGCYAGSGPLKLHWDKVSRGERGISWDEFCDKINTLPDGQLWRHNQAGDLPGDGDQIDREARAKLVTANLGRKGFTYTHYDFETDADNRAIVFEANRWGFTVNLSGNNADHADTLAALNIGPVVTVLPSDLERGSHKKEWTESLTDYRARVADVATPEGRRIVICPATYQENVSCATCGLCQKQAGRAIVGFPAHGTSKRKADTVATLAPQFAIAAE